MAVYNQGGLFCSGRTVACQRLHWRLFLSFSDSPRNTYTKENWNTLHSTFDWDCKPVLEAEH